MLPLFSSDRKAIRKLQYDQGLMIIFTTVWQTQTWFPGLPKMSVSSRKSGTSNGPSRKITTLKVNKNP